MALRIKKEIDLKELEKFGFIWTIYEYYSKFIYEGRRGQMFNLIIRKDRYIQGYAYGADGDGEENYIDDTLYDLIKADMVEKVEE